MPELTPLPPLRQPRTFTGRSDYRRQLKAYQGRAVRTAREENGGNITADEARAIRDRVFAKFVAAHGTIEDVPALDSAAQGGREGNGAPVLKILTPVEHAARLAQEGRATQTQQIRPLVVNGTRLKIKAAPLPGDLATSAQPTHEAETAEPTTPATNVPNGARVVVACAADCGAWVQAKDRKPQLRYCRSHTPRPRRRRIAPVDDLAAEV